jgi:hypothetical protein
LLPDMGRFHHTMGSGLAVIPITEWSIASGGGKQVDQQLVGGRSACAGQRQPTALLRRFSPEEIQHLPDDGEQRLPLSRPHKPLVQ